MSDLVVTLGSLIATLGNLRSGDVKDAHIDLLKTNVEMVRLRLIELEQANARLEQENREISEQLAHCRRAAEMKEYRGAMWVRESTGRYSATPVCLRCHSTMTPGDAWNTKVFECGSPRCGHRANFYAHEIESILRELNQGAT